MIGHKKVPGPLAVLADGFRTELDRLGYTPSSREFKLAEVAKLSAWLESRGLGAGDICPARIEEFLSDLAARPGRAPTLVAMRPLLAWLGRLGLARDDPPSGTRAAGRADGALSPLDGDRPPAGGAHDQAL